MINAQGQLSADTGAQASYSISELSREFEVTTRTIRFYEDEGLLRPERVGRQRVYSPGDRVRLKLILRGKRLGFSITSDGVMVMQLRHHL